MDNGTWSFPQGFRALVIGASGAIGAAMVSQLQADSRCASVTVLHRQSQPPIDFTDEASIGAAAAALADQAPFHLILVATGILHSAEFKPEKRLADLNYAQMEENLRINAFGPALCLRHFAKLLDPQRAVLAVLSAKVGSIEDNRLGGWYSYRASKAALNMLLKTAAIELRRSQPNAVVIALHPGTVSSALSAPFRGAEIGRPPLQAASEMLATLERLGPADSGRFYAYDGERLPW